MIYLDLDGVLADLVKQVERFAKIPPIYNQDNYGTYRMQDATDDLTFGTIKDLFNRMDFWSCMPKTQWADDVCLWIDRLASRLGKTNEVYILTRPWLKDGLCSTRRCLKGKVEWIVQHFPHYSGRVIFSDVKDVFANPDSILIDDNLDNCKGFAAAGGKTIFLPTPWGDKDYAQRQYTGTKLIEETLKWETPLVESMLH